MKPKSILELYIIWRQKCSHVAPQKRQNLCCSRFFLQIIYLTTFFPLRFKSIFRDDYHDFCSENEIAISSFLCYESDSVWQVIHGKSIPKLIFHFQDFMQNIAVNSCIDPISHGKKQYAKRAFYIRSVLYYHFSMPQVASHVDGQYENF